MKAELKNKEISILASRDGEQNLFMCQYVSMILYTLIYSAI